MSLVIYTDGSCINEIGGYGVVVLRDNEIVQKMNGRVPIDPCTNNRAELYAILKALQYSSEDNFTIITDSKYCIGCLTQWMSNWKKSGWKGIKNKELIESLDNTRNGRNITFKHVAAHCGDYYNEMCNKLAKDGAKI